MHEFHVEWWGCIPFASLLACIALFPLLPRVKHLWHHNWFQLVVALTFGLPVAAWMLGIGNTHGVVHALVEYVQFICLLLALYVVSGNILITGDIQATPRNNTIFLGIGLTLASFIGTTGAAMLLIRPLIKTNRERKKRIHTVVFFIFLVANCGGLLTPLGDPPLFLGMLRGVPFTWTFSLLPQWLLVNGLMLIVYFGLDRKEYASEQPEDIRLDDTQIVPIGILGKINFLWLAGIVAAVAFLPSVDLDAYHEHHDLTSLIPARELAMVAAILISLFVVNQEPRVRNTFTWGPILEVACLFIGIFLAMVPALEYLRVVAPTLPLNEVTLFWFTGGLSSVLDNAPTYVTFFEMAREMPGEPRVANVPEIYLASISLGAVFMGAMTYIGNGPNFMVKSIAESENVKMPSFVGYFILWALRNLLPTLVAMVLIFVVQDWTIKALGVGLAGGIALQALYRAYRYRDPHTLVLQ